MNGLSAALLSIVATCMYFIGCFFCKKEVSIIPIKPTTNNKKIADLISQEFLTPLEETRLAIEEVVIAKNIPIDLIPRTSRIRKQQHELVTHYQLKGVSVGKEQNRRIRILPN